MENKTITHTVSLNLFTIAFILSMVFMVLKLCGIIAWAWVMVFLPIIIVVGLWLLLMLIPIIISIIIGLASYFRDKKKNN